jgi:hypothetical protein
MLLLNHTCLQIFHSNLSPLFPRIGYHSLLNPSPAFRCLLLHLFGVLLQLLHLVWIRNMSALLDSRSSEHSLVPSLQSRKFVNVYTSPERSCDPSYKSRFRSQYCFIWTNYELRNRFHELGNDDALETRLVSNSQSPPTHETVRKREMCS